MKSVSILLLLGLFVAMCAFSARVEASEFDPLSAMSLAPPPNHHRYKVSKAAPSALKAKLGKSYPSAFGSSAFRSLIERSKQASESAQILSDSEIRNANIQHLLADSAKLSPIEAAAVEGIVFEKSVAPLKSLSLLESTSSSMRHKKLNKFQREQARLRKDLEQKRKREKRERRAARKGIKELAKQSHTVVEHVMDAIAKPEDWRPLDFPHSAHLPSQPPPLGLMKHKVSPHQYSHHHVPEVYMAPMTGKLGRTDRTYDDRIENALHTVKSFLKRQIASLRHERKWTKRTERLIKQLNHKKDRVSHHSERLAREIRALLKRQTQLRNKIAQDKIINKLETTTKHLAILREQNHNLNRNKAAMMDQEEKIEHIMNKIGRHIAQLNGMRVKKLIPVPKRSEKVIARLDKTLPLVEMLKESSHMRKLKYPSELLDYDPGKVEMDAVDKDLQAVLDS